MEVHRVDKIYTFLTYSCSLEQRSITFLQITDLSDSRKFLMKKRQQKERKKYPNVCHLWPNSGHDVARGNWKVDWNPRSISPRDASPFGRPTPVRVERFTRFRVNRIINEDRAEFQACDATRVSRINRTSSRATATAAFSLRKRRFRAVRQIIAATSICVPAVACLTPEY